MRRLCKRRAVSVRMTLNDLISDSIQGRTLFDFALLYSVPDYEYVESGDVGRSARWTTRLTSLCDNINPL